MSHCLYYIETYGCQMNVHDSEKLAGSLEKHGFLPASTLEEADIAVFNTCCIRDTAEKRIYGNIGALKQRKLRDKNMVIAVVGCMTQQAGAADALKSKFPFIDVILGTVNAHLLGEKVEEVLQSRNGKRVKFLETEEAANPEILEDLPVKRSSGTNAWVNIMYGCDNFCTYCIVPYVRGRERSREPQTVLHEIKTLLQEGYKEITLLGQNVNSYGLDKESGYRFPDLLKEAANLGGKYRIRFMTSHPKDMSDQLIDVVAECDNIPKNIHLPVQAGSNRILSVMNRKYTVEQYLSLIEKIREKMPLCGITTDIMVGFPGETEEDFLETLRLVEKVRFSNAFMFVYSPRKGTAAAKMEQLPYAVKKDRITRLVALQNKISAEISEEYVGRKEEVLVEDSPKEGYLCGRTGSGRLVNFPGEKTLIGQFVLVNINKNKASSLWGTIENEGK